MAPMGLENEGQNLAKKKYQWVKLTFVCTRSYSRPEISSRIFRRLNKLRLILAIRPKISQKMFMKAEKITPYFSHKGKNKPKMAPMGLENEGRALLQ